MPRDKKSFVVVSLHDVSPLHWETIGTIVQDLHRLDANLKISLLIIANHHRRAPLGKNPEFGQWLREMVALGHEPVVHGYEHWRSSRPGESALTRLVTAHYTAGEGEFFDLSREEAGRRLRRGREEVELCCGRKPEGFIAPAWLLGPEAAQAVADEGFLYTTRLHQLEVLHPARQNYRSQSLVWSVRSAWRRMASLGWNALLFRALDGNDLLRLGIHPPDWKFPAIRRQILRLLRQALAHREPKTYDGWVHQILP